MHAVGTGAAGTDVIGTQLRRTSQACRNAKDHYTDEREARDQRIEEAEQAGWSLRRIARETGLSPGHVERIIAARTAARQAGLQAALVS